MEENSIQILSLLMLMEVFRKKLLEYHIVQGVNHFLMAYTASAVTIHYFLILPLKNAKYVLMIQFLTKKLSFASPIYFSLILMEKISTWSGKPPLRHPTLHLKLAPRINPLLMEYYVLPALYLSFFIWKMGNANLVQMDYSLILQLVVVEEGQAQNLIVIFWDNETSLGKYRFISHYWEFVQKIRGISMEWNA